MEILNFTEIDKIGLILGLFSIFIGIKYPDWDFKLKLKHRSILTHSPIILILFIYLYLDKQNDFLWYHSNNEIGFRYFIMGFSIGMAIHFIYDLFPKGWAGSALLHVPLLNIRLKKNITIFSFLIFTVFSLVIAIKLSKNTEELVLFFLLGIILLWLNKKAERKLIRPTITFILFFTLIASYENPDFYKIVIETSAVIYQNLVKLFNYIFTYFS